MAKIARLIHIRNQPIDVIGRCRHGRASRNFRNISEVPEDDAEMKAAIAKARETFPNSGKSSISTSTARLTFHSRSRLPTNMVASIFG
jgi:hypothetical protein